ncbi:MAG: hypothetical protein IJJ28_03035, partial [Lentisphaeria bacterium]|nr:hypothetical protein [Lentisphaeria bacterium]
FQTAGRICSEKSPGGDPGGARRPGQNGVIRAGYDRKINCFCEKKTFFVRFRFEKRSRWWQFNAELPEKNDEVRAEEQSSMVSRRWS